MATNYKPLLIFHYNSIFHHKNDFYHYNFYSCNNNIFLGHASCHQAILHHILKFLLDPYFIYQSYIICLCHKVYHFQTDHGIHGHQKCKNKCHFPKTYLACSLILHTYRHCLISLLVFFQVRYWKHYYETKLNFHHLILNYSMKFETQFVKAILIWKDFLFTHPFFEEKIDILIQMDSVTTFEHNLFGQLHIAYFCSFDMDLFNYISTKFQINIQQVLVELTFCTQLVKQDLSDQLENCFD